MRFKEWNKKVNDLSAEYKALDERADESVGGKIYVEAHGQPSITYFIRKIKAEHLHAWEVDTEGRPCVILGSKLYPGVGILLWNAPQAQLSKDARPGRYLRIANGDDYWEGAHWEIPCVCCCPYVDGLAHSKVLEADPNTRDEMAARWVAAIRAACKKAAIAKLYFRGITEAPTRSRLSKHLRQDVDGLRFVDGVNFDKELDVWRFLAAFSEMGTLKKGNFFSHKWEERPAKKAKS